MKSSIEMRSNRLFPAVYLEESNIILCRRKEGSIRSSSIMSAKRYLAVPVGSLKKMLLGVRSVVHVSSAQQDDDDDDGVSCLYGRFRNYGDKLVRTEAIGWWILL